MTALDASLALEPDGEGAWRALADPTREANTGMFGGWTAALLANAALKDPRASGSLSAITVNYINRVPPGSALTLRSQPLGGGKSMTHWRCELFVDGAEGVAAVAHIVLANRRESDRFTEYKMPEAAAPDTFPVFNPPGPFGATVNIYTAFGANPFNQPTTRSVSWLREAGGKLMDELLLVYMSDVGWPRSWALGASPRPSSTTTLSVYIHATPSEIAACGDDYILSDFVGTRIEHSTVGSRANLWSRAGALLATTEQLCWFR
jgi:acyl-CoA thioesterase